MGGGIAFWENSQPTCESNTIVENSASVEGGGIYCNSIWADPLVITNTIFWDNSGPTGQEIWIGEGGYFSILTLSYSDVQGGQSSVYVDPGSTLNWGAGMIDADPLFVTGPMGDYYLSQLAAGQGTDSPCVDTGDPTSAMIIGTTRTDEIQDSGVVDMGFHYPLP
jgi:hypothetical protein